LERHIAEMPDGKLELIDGQLIISTVAGSRWILFEILRDYGPPLVLPMASSALRWRGLQEAFDPRPSPRGCPGIRIGQRGELTAEHHFPFVLADAPNPDLSQSYGRCGRLIRIR
jgi:hypothetical protein